MQNNQFNYRCKLQVGFRSFSKISSCISLIVLNNYICSIVQNRIKTIPSNYKSLKVQLSFFTCLTMGYVSEFVVLSAGNLKSDVSKEELCHSGFLQRAIM